MPRSVPDPALARSKYGRAAASYDRRLRLTERYRRRAVERLSLRPGDRVLDVACGTGINFELIRERIGPTGQLIGVDLSAEMLELAERRVEAAGWQNVDLIESAIEDARLPGPFDAVLFSLTHDVLQSDAALENIVARLAPGARVASFGSMWAPRWRLPVNAAVWLVARSYVTTFDGFRRPWRRLLRHAPDLRVEQVALGGAYIAGGTVPARNARWAELPH